MGLKIIIAPQSFKGSVSGLVAAQAIARGVLAVEPTAVTVLVPVADGGDGTLDALVEGTGGQTFRSVVTGPLGQQVEASWGVMRDGQTAVIEMARASGLALLPPRKRNPRVATTRGTGELIKEALERGYTRILVGLGGSATNDGGAGMAAALGFKFLDAKGHPLPAGGSALAKLSRIDFSSKHSRLAQATVVGVTDVTNPLCGPTGASAIYGPQKGASPDVVAELDAALQHFAKVVQRDLGHSVLALPRTGAAGGLGAGLVAFAGGELRSGIDMVCEAVGFDQHLEGASLVITGEGRADHSSIYDKAPVGVARRAQAKGVPTILLAGSLGAGYEQLYQHGIAGIMCIADRPMTFEQSLSRTEELLAGAAERALRLMRLGSAVRA